MISRVTHELRRRRARRARMVRGQCVKWPRIVIGSRLGTDSTVVAGRLPFSAPDVGRTGALVGSVPKRPPMEMISRVRHDLRRRCARRARTVRGQCVKGPRIFIGSRLGPTLPSWLVVCRLASPDLGRTGALVGSVPKRPPMEMISRVTHDLRRRCARRARMARGQCVKGPRIVIGSRLGTDSTVVAGRLLFSV